ncbi:MAG: FAD-dependent oxidoreductase [Thermoplasmata archaeon]
MIENKSDAVILGGNIFSLYAGILLEKNGLNVTIIENDLYSSILENGPLFFINFEDEKRKMLNYRSKEIFKELMRKNTREIIWPIDLFDRLKDKFSGKILNFSKFKEFFYDGIEISGIDAGLKISTNLVLVMDGILLKNFLNGKGYELKNYSFEFGNAVLMASGKDNIYYFYNDYLFIKQGDTVFASTIWENTKTNSFKKILTKGYEIVPGLENSLVKRFWKNRHDLFPDSLPRIGNILYKNFYFMAGYSRFGISLGLELSRLLTQLALGKPLDMDIDSLKVIQST